MTIDEKINRLREAVNRLRRYTPVEDFGAEARACKRTAEGFEQEADWLEEWSEEHPQETRLSRFLKYYPNAPLDMYGIPRACVKDFGIVEYEYLCSDDCTDCSDCWNTPIEEE